MSNSCSTSSYPIRRKTPTRSGSNVNRNYVPSTYRPSICQCNQSNQSNQSNRSCHQSLPWYNKSNKPSFLDYKVNGSHSARKTCPSIPAKYHSPYTQCSGKCCC
ncbi:hypothetical protein qu_618 [Acanthamoeba polyphaga mimivirus]|nr:hypothetical protein [Mimivirus reunion]WMV61952.1 hypothetical protein qu_618 [Mimivirus sp.]WMV62929.1 hypothetical protein qu_618 [Acanthamoeba polyphaga mimivirus]WMV63906.1 hypothetical protein qu_618 [Mimivirus sp.]